MGSRYWWFMSSVSQFPHASSPYLFMSMALFNLMSTFSPSLIIQTSSQPALGSEDVCPLFVWLFVQGCGRGTLARRAQTFGPSWGRNTQKWRWCTEQVKTHTKKTQNKNHPGCCRLYFQPTNKCTRKQFQFQNALNICIIQSACYLLITKHLIINKHAFKAPCLV